MAAELNQIIQWRASDQSTVDQSLYRNPFELGTGAALDASGGKFGGGCFHSNGASTAVVPTPVTSRQNIGTSDFYFSCWYKRDGANYNASRQVFIGKGSASLQAFMIGLAGTDLFFYHTTNGTTATEAQLSASVTIVDGTWYHIACSRSSGTVRLFLDGVQVASGSYPTTYVTTAQTTVGSYGVSGFPYPVKGSLNDVWLVIGEAVHTSGFTPETDYLPLHTLVPFYRDVSRSYKAGAARPVPSPSCLGTTTYYWDYYHHGTYKLEGTVKKFNSPDNIPLERQVFLLREPSLLCLKSMWSDPVTGEWSFTDLSGAYRYTVIAYDYEHLYRAVLADNRPPDLM